VQRDANEIGVFLITFIPRGAKLEHERLNNIIFVKYNLRLERRQKERKMKGDHYNPIELLDMNSGDEWITEKQTPVLQDESDIEAPIYFIPVAQDYSWKDLSECFIEENVGTRQEKKMRYKFIFIFKYFMYLYLQDKIAFGLHFVARTKRFETK
jgi:hypothetical protein